ncbi:SET domain-containing protein [uncultured Winogradskyella sp.]|uniref:SET domain-containing protein-lysine N-methyltransferase n=1 Tax=Winogradskyella sp. 4-2091 TaxID=3381659 RepID=UPI00260507BD|nr:SET domain-containing protein [uncultured Winogradskyella sp.]
MNNSKKEDDYISLNIIEAAESDYLYTETSQIENAGKGLFTAIDIFEDEIIALFQGDIINNQEAEKRAQRNEDRYFINLLDGSIMDSMHTDCFAKYANDAEGLIESSFKNNAIITLDDNDNVCIKAIKNIDAGEEIFCSYGKPYWKKHAN